jgi:hypothetical protein
MDDDGALPQGTNTNLHRMVTNLSGQARVGEFISLERAQFIDDFFRKNTKKSFSRANLLCPSIFVDFSAGVIDMNVIWIPGHGFNHWTFSVTISLNSNTESLMILKSQGNTPRRAATLLHHFLQLSPA